MKRRKPTVITIASVLGGGKTTVTQQLRKALPRSSAIFFDDYDLDGPSDMVDWLERGADYQEWDVMNLVEDVENQRTQKLDYVLLDFPFSYIHQQMREYIDYSVFIDTPLDLALARRIIRDYADDSTEEIVRRMAFYCSSSRAAYLEMLHTIKPSADVVIDGNQPVYAIVDTIVDSIMVHASHKENP
ncbi:hypothetical protein [Alkalicoccus chagannorensis]|uniref:hypothetical protein n=1 Tax=Alkalicoccus chagannorensis TaxID=427072 RepID=UPI000422CD17|nr:hypothetical protein [Alkalicoccus chagannorensis]